jgi:hypothetical protein
MVRACPACRSRGFVGGVLTGVFASLTVNAAGEAGGIVQLGRQLVLAGLGIVYPFVLTWAGLDLSEHGEPAYQFPTAVLLGGPSASAEPSAAASWLACAYPTWLDGWPRARRLAVTSQVRTSGRNGCRPADAWAREYWPGAVSYSGRRSAGQLRAVLVSLRRTKIVSGTARALPAAECRRRRGRAGSPCEDDAVG